MCSVGGRPGPGLRNTALKGYPIMFSSLTHAVPDVYDVLFFR